MKITFLLNQCLRLFSNFGSSALDRPFKILNFGTFPGFGIFLALSKLTLGRSYRQGKKAKSCGMVS